MGISKKKIEQDPVIGFMVTAEPVKKTRTLYLNDKLFLALRSHCEEINKTNVGKRKIKPCDVIDRLTELYLQGKIEIK